MKYGLWDQLRADCGTEFYLSLFMQEKLSGHRYNTDRPAFLQTPSTSVGFLCFCSSVCCTVKLACSDYSISMLVNMHSIVKSFNVLLYPPFEFEFFCLHALVGLNDMQICFFFS